MSHKTYTVNYRRKREGKTNYKKRIKIVSGKKIRAVIRISNKNLLIQAIEYSKTGDKIKASAHSKQLSKLGWKASQNNTSAVYLLGLLFGKKAKEKGIKEVIADVGMTTVTKGNLVMAAVKGIKDSGIKINADEKVLPEEQRIKGQHIAEYAKELKKNKQKYEKQFSKYIKNNFDPEQLPKHFEEIKNKINK